MKETVDTICAWLGPARATQQTYGRYVAMANERMAELITRIQTGEPIYAEALARLAINLCPLARKIGWVPDKRTLTATGQRPPAAYIAGANRALSGIILNAEQGRTDDLHTKLDQLFALLDGYCRHLGTDLASEISRVVDAPDPSPVPRAARGAAAAF